MESKIEESSEHLLHYSFQHVRYLSEQRIGLQHFQAFGSFRVEQHLCSIERIPLSNKPVITKRRNGSVPPASDKLGARIWQSSPVGIECKVGPC